jgi:hypothetical protein
LQYPEFLRWVKEQIIIKDIRGAGVSSRGLMIRKIVAWSWVLALLVALLMVSSVIMLAPIAEL